MALTIRQQYDLAVQAITSGDVDLLSRLLTDPNTITPKDQRTVAERLGVKGGMLSAFTDIISDPTVWVAFLLSRTFPVASYLRGTIPQRHIGAAAEFTGISAFTRPIENFFRGTSIPRLVSLSMRRNAEVMKVGKSMLAPLERPNWKEEMPIVSLLMEGQRAPGATPELEQVARTIRSGMDDLWGLMSQAQRITGGFQGDVISRAASGPHLGKAPRYLRDYLPHIPLTTRSALIEADGLAALQRMGRGSFAQAMKLRGMRPQDVWRPTAANSLASDFTRYQGFMQAVGHTINPRLFPRSRFGIPLESGLGKELFITDLNAILPQYLENVARTYSLNAPISQFERQLASAEFRDASGALRRTTPSSDPIIVQIINEGLGSAGARFERRRIPMQRHPGELRFKEVETLIPGSTNAPMLRALERLTASMQGKASEDEIMFGNIFSSMGAKLDRMRGTLTGKQINQVDAAIRSVERTRSYREKMNGVASYFYASTLGLNPFSAFQNMLQPILTTAPSIGIGPTLAGYKVLASRIPAYARAVAAEHRLLRGNKRIGATFKLNEAMHRGFSKTFPELAEQGIRIDPRLFEIDEAALIQHDRKFFGTKLFRDRDQFYRLLLQPFTHTEMSNQIITFYGAKQSLRNASRMGGYHIPSGMAESQIEQALNFEAGLMVNATQFRPGPGSRSIFQGMLPAPFRQFTSFPTRLFNFYADSTVRGAMTNQQMQQASVFNALQSGEAGQLARQKLLSLGTGRNLGTMARTFLYSKIAVKGAREALGVDLGRSLGIVEPFNLAPDYQPFAPLPLAPIPGLVFAVASASATRDIKRLQPMELPGVGSIPVPRTLVPGGIAITRASRALNQFRPDVGGFFDDQERLMYRGDSSDLALSMLGIPLDKNRRMREAVERIQANRTRIRQLRRSYATAALHTDFGEMDRLSTMWKERFPDLPPLSVSPRDLRRYEMNQRIPIVQRLLNTVSKDHKKVIFDYDYDEDLVAPVLPAGLPALP